MTGMLEEIFRLQYELQKRIGIDLVGMSDDDRAKAIRDNVLDCTDELHEAMRMTRHKPWATTHTPLFRDREKYLEELVDALHFFVNLCLHGWVTAEDLYLAYLAKNQVNHERQDSGTYDGIGEEHDRADVR